MKHPIAWLLPVALAVNHCEALADEPQPSSPITISGFGTFGMSKLNTSDGEFLNDIRQHHGATDKVGFDLDSKLGVQLTYSLTPSTSITSQFLVRPDETGKWKPSVDWLYLKSRINSDLTARAGRIGAPFFMISDFRNVSYSNTWVRPPVEVYGQVPFNNVDGADVLYQKTIDEVVVNTQVMVGSSTSKLIDGTANYKLTKLVALNGSVEWGPVTFRIGHLTTRMTAADAPLVNGLLGALRGLGQNPGLEGLALLADQLAVQDKKVTFDGIGMAFDWNDWLVSTELTRRTTHSFVSDVTGWYTTVGYRLGSFTPYATTAKVRQDSPTTAPAIPPIPQLAGLKAGVEGGLLSAVNQKSVSMGVRWDAMRNLALKGQIDRIRVDEQGLTWRAQLPTLAGKTVTLYSLSADFVF